MSEIAVRRTFAAVGVVLLIVFVVVIPAADIHQTAQPIARDAHLQALDRMLEITSPPFAASVGTAFSSPSGAARSYSDPAFTTVPRLPFSLKNGTELIRTRRRGRGSLEVQNGSEWDAIVSLSLGDRRRRAIYIRRAQTGSIRHIAAGNYAIRYTLGEDWDPGHKKFKNSSKSFEFEEIASFEEVLSGGTVHFSKYTITLQPVVGGNARTKPLNRDQIVFDEFDEYEDTD